MHVIVIATLDGGGGPFRIGATERGIAAAGWQPDEGAFRADLSRRFAAPVVDLADAAGDEPPASVLRAALPAFEALLRGAIDLAFSLEQDVWNGERYLQLSVADFKAPDN